MSSASNRRKSGGDGDDGGGANWMDTYGDLVTLLLTFFVLLFAFSTIDAEKFKALASSFGVNIVLFNPVSPQTVMDPPIQDPTQGLAELAERNAQADSDSAADADDNDPMVLEHTMWEMYEHMVAFVTRENLDAEVVLIEDDYMIRLILNDMVFFRTAEADLLPESIPILDKVIQMFDEVSHLYRMLSIEGHTDSRPINTPRYPSNWELSSDRALQVGSYVRNTGLLDEDRLQVVGYGERHPIAPNDSLENMARNRRVEFVAETKTPPHRGRSPVNPDMEALLTQTGDTR